jgi:hypothetical protein
VSHPEDSAWNNNVLRASAQMIKMYGERGPLLNASRRLKTVRLLPINEDGEPD